MRQITTAIALRNYEEDYRKRRLTEWQTKTLAQFIAATVPVPKGSKPKLMEHASKISLFPDPGGGESATDSNKGEPAVGSYERLMAFAGRANLT